MAMIARILKRQKLTVFMFIGILLFDCQAAFACRCVPMTPRSRLKDSRAVFSGVVVSVIKLDDSNILLTFKVRKSWKGVSSRTIKVAAGNGQLSCDTKFFLGREYLVFAYSKKTIGLYTDYCNAKQSRDATEDIKALGNIRHEH